MYIFSMKTFFHLFVSCEVNKTYYIKNTSFVIVNVFITSTGLLDAQMLPLFPTELKLC